MQNMLLACPVLSDNSTLTGSASSGALGINNLKEIDLKQVYRVNNTTAFIVSDLGAYQKINFVAIVGHNGSSRSFARVRAANSMSDLTSNPTFDTGDVPFRSHQTGYDNLWAASVTDEDYGSMPKNLFFQYFHDINCRYWRIDIVDPDAKYIDLGRLYISQAWQPETNIDYGISHGLIDPSRKARTKAGSTVSVELSPYRYVDFKLGFGSEVEMFDHAFEFDRLRGRTKDVLFIHDPDAKAYLQKRSVYGTMESLQPVVNTAFDIFEKTFRIEEITP
jgi:hypothetical protein